MHSGVGCSASSCESLPKLSLRPMCLQHVRHVARSNTTSVYTVIYEGEPPALQTTAQASAPRGGRRGCTCGVEHRSVTVEPFPSSLDERTDGTFIHATALTTTLIGMSILYSISYRGDSRIGASTGFGAAPGIAKPPDGT